MQEDHLDQNIKSAARAFRRLYNRFMSEHAEIAAADAKFDGGEWSGPWHADYIEKEGGRLLNYVAERFGVHPKELDLTIREFEHRPFGFCPTEY